MGSSGDGATACSIFDALPVEEVGIHAYTTPPKPVRGRRRRRHVFSFLIPTRTHHVILQHVIHIRVCAFFVATQVHANGDDGLETVAAARHVGHGIAVFVARRVQHEHAEAEEGVAEEDCYGEQDHDEEDVDFLAEGAVGKGDG